MNDKKPLPQLLSKLVKKISSSYQSSILEPAETAVREWLEEISSDENLYSEDKIIIDCSDQAN